MATTHSTPPLRLDQPLRPERLLEKGLSRRIVQHAQSSRKKLTPSESYLILHPSMERSSFDESDDSSSLDDASDDKMSFSEDVVALLASLDDSVLSSSSTGALVGMRCCCRAAAIADKKSPTWVACNVGGAKVSLLLLLRLRLHEKSAGPMRPSLSASPRKSAPQSQ